MKVKNVSGVARGVTPADAEAFVVDDGDVVEVSAALGRSLCEQPANWSEVTTTKEKN
jgi:hypothetical protein